MNKTNINLFQDLSEEEIDKAFNLIQADVETSRFAEIEMHIELMLAEKGDK